MLGVNNIRIIRYKTMKVTILDSITQVFSHTRCPQLMLTYGHNIPVCLSMVLVQVVDVFRQRKSTMCLVVYGNKMLPTLRSINCHVAHAEFLCFSSKTTRLSSLNALNHTILLQKPYTLPFHILSQCDIHSDTSKF